MTTRSDAAFERLVQLMRTLRSPGGCPWDREQTLQTLAPFVLEETYEVIDAIERNDLDALKEEVGDLIFEGVFLAQVAVDMGAFTVADALEAVIDKLVRRHPHVFKESGEVHDAASKARAPSARAALERWESLKAQERTAIGQTHSTLSGLPSSLPALLRAFKIGKRAAAVGFDWQRTEDVIAKVEEELAELREVVERIGPVRSDLSEADDVTVASRSSRTESEVEKLPVASEFQPPRVSDALRLGRPETSGNREKAKAGSHANAAVQNRARIEEEMGDLLFALANLARKLGIEPEAALRRANEKFTKRFNELERQFAARGQRLDQSTLDEMEVEWQNVKRSNEQ